MYMGDTRLFKKNEKELETLIQTRIEKEIEHRRKNRDHSDYRVVKINQNTEKSSGDLKKLAVT